MFRITLFYSVLLFFSCTSTIQTPPAVDYLVQKLESVVLNASSSQDYFKILSEIDSLERVDFIPDLKRIDSLIIREWIMPSSKIKLSRSHTPPFYIELRQKLSNTIFSLQMKEKGLITNEEKYIYAFCNLNNGYLRSTHSINPSYGFIKENIDIFALFVKDSILDKNVQGNKDFLMSTFEETIKKYGNENTKKIVAEQLIEIYKDRVSQKSGHLSSCKLIYLLGISKSDLAKEYFLKALKDEKDIKIRDCMISTLKYWFDLSI